MQTGKTSVEAAQKQAADTRSVRNEKLQDDVSAGRGYGALLHSYACCTFLPVPDEFLGLSQ